MIRARIRRGIIYVTTRDGRAATFGKLFTYAGGRIGFRVAEGGATQNKCRRYLLGYTTIKPKTRIMAWRLDQT